MKGTYSSPEQETISADSSGFFPLWFGSIRASVSSDKASTDRAPFNPLKGMEMELRDVEEKKLQETGRPQARPPATTTDAGAAQEEIEMSWWPKMS